MYAPPYRIYRLTNPAGRGHLDWAIRIFNNGSVDVCAGRDGRIERRIHHDAQSGRGEHERGVLKAKQRKGYRYIGFAAISDDGVIDPAVFAHHNTPSIRRSAARAWRRSSGMRSKPSGRRCTSERSVGYANADHGLVFSRSQGTGR